MISLLSRKEYFYRWSAVLPPVAIAEILSCRLGSTPCAPKDRQDSTSALVTEWLGGGIIWDDIQSSWANKKDMG